MEHEIRKTPLTPEAFVALGAPSMVYVREVRAGELDGAPGLESAPPDVRLWAVHAANGARMAVLDDRDAAFFTARQNDFAPVSVH